jgi:hypothetical protein
MLALYFGRRGVGLKGEGLRLKRDAPCRFFPVMAAAGPSPSLQDFLQPLSIDLTRVIVLAASLSKAYRRLAAESDNQFLSTPISDSTLSPSAAEEGRYGVFSYPSEQ